MTKERIEKELSKVRGQLADLQEKQKDLESQLQMAEDSWEPTGPGCWYIRSEDVV